MKKLLLLFVTSLSLWGQTQIGPGDIRPLATTVTQLYAAIPLPTGTQFGVLSISSDFILDTSTTPWTIKLAPTQQQQINFVIGEVPAGLVNGTNATFTTQFTPINSSVAIYRNGLRQKLGLDYTLSVSGVVTFASNAIPRTGDLLLVDYRR